MSLYKLCEWEENGYHDSDFLIAVWDDETKTIRPIEIGSTRYAGGISCPELQPLNALVVESARQYLENEIFKQIREAEYREILEPNLVVVGERVRLLEKHRNIAKDFEEVPCPKCGGTGKWVSPNNKQDTRQCFGCKGKKFVKKNFQKTIIGDKVVYIHFDAGLAGVVRSVHCYEKIYRNGYNKQGRHNLNIIVELDDGRELKIPLKKLRLDREPMTDEELRERAKSLSYEMNPKPLCTKHTGWLRTNEAYDYLKKLGVVKCS